MLMFKGFSATGLNNGLTSRSALITKLNKYVFGAFAIALFSVICEHSFRCSFLPFLCKDKHFSSYDNLDFDKLTNLSRPRIHRISDYLEKKKAGFEPTSLVKLTIVTTWLGEHSTSPARHGFAVRPSSRPCS